MKLQKAVQLIKDCAKRMDMAYSGTVFDEWAIVAFNRNQPKLLFYTGPSEQDFIVNLTSNHDLLHQLQQAELGFGDFVFSHEGFGARADGLLMLGPAVYLICNNTKRSISQITSNPLWKSVQVAFVELADSFRADPLLNPTE